MRFTITTTNGGKHSDEKLAYAMARDLVEDAATMTGQDALDMRKLENQLGDQFAAEFRKIADRENAALADKGHEHLAASLDAHPEHAAEMEAAVFAVYEASPFAANMDKAAAAKNVHEVVAKWVKNAQHMHRDWFAGAGKIGHHLELTDHPSWDPNNEHVKRWKDYHNAPTPEAHRRALHELHTGEKLPPL